MPRARQIVGFGGPGESDEQTRQLLRYVLALTEARSPRLLLLSTAQGDSDAAVVRKYELFSGLGQLAHMAFFPWPPERARELVLAQDAVYVGGGNTANMLAIWRTHGFERILREAWERGIVLFGGSAGMICWFEASVTDSFGPRLEGLRDGLGFLPGSACPHYDAEARRRPRYRELVDAGFPPGVAADNGVALHYRGPALHEVVSCRPGGSAYRVSAGVEERLEARLLDGRARP
jgi:dipeptidase E